MFLMLFVIVEKIICSNKLKKNYAFVEMAIRFGVYLIEIKKKLNSYTANQQHTNCYLTAT